MNSRERLLATLERTPPDRVPISTYELAGYNSKAFENQEPSYARLMQAIREKTDCVCMWNPACNGTFLASSSALEMEATTSREGDTTTHHRILHTPNGDLTQITKVVDNIRTVWQTEHWCKSPADVDRALSVPYQPIDYDASDYPRILDEVGDNGIIMASLADPLCIAADLMAFGDYTVWAMTETDHFARTIDIIHERCMENLRRMLAINIVDLYRICGAEYATPPYLPPSFFERFAVPYVRDMVELIHAKGTKARFHCHGRIGRVLNMIAETGADAIDPCEAPPDGDVTLAEVKKQLGATMCIFGNLQLKLLEHGSPAQVEQTVRECMDAAKEDGGYVIMPTAAPISIPLAKKTEQNYLRFFEAALECGQY